MNTSHVIASLGWTLLHFVWQGGLIGCATAALLAVLRGAAPERRYAVACVALLLCLAWPLAGFVAALQAGPARPPGLPLPLPGASGAALAEGSGVLVWLGGHLAWVVSAWACCAALLGLRMVAGLVWVGRMRREQARDPLWEARLARIAQRLGVTRKVCLRVVDGLASPVTAGWWRPVVLVPASLLSGMAPDLLDALLAHEIAHVRRHDYLVNLVQNVIETLLFYHPAVWWLSHRIRVERELVADGLAARGLGEPRRLARALSELERLQFGGGHLAQAATGGDLAARIFRLVRPEARTLHWQAALPVLAIAVAGFASAHVTGAIAIRSAPAYGLNARIDFHSCATPQYPAADVAANHVGNVDVLFFVDADGRVRDSRITGSSGYPSLDAATRSALAKCRFKPPLVDGRPVATWAPVRYIWQLD